MVIYNRYILILASLMLASCVLLVWLGVERLDAYLTVYVVETLAVSELYRRFNPVARRGLAVISSMLFAAFVVVMIIQLLRIILGLA